MTNKTVITKENGKVRVIHDGRIIFESLLENISACEMCGPVYMSSHLLDLHFRNRNLKPSIFYDLALVIHQQEPSTKIDWLQTLFNIELRIYIEQVYKLKISYLSPNDLLDQLLCTKLRRSAETVDEQTIVAIGKKINSKLCALGLPYLEKRISGVANVTRKK